MSPHRPTTHFDDETAELPPVSMPQSHQSDRIEPPTDGFRNFRITWGDRAIVLILTGALFLAGMVLRHELMLSEINLKLSWIMRAMKVDP